MSSTFTDFASREEVYTLLHELKKEPQSTNSKSHSLSIASKAPQTHTTTLILNENWVLVANGVTPQSNTFLGSIKTNPGTSSSTQLPTPNEDWDVIGAETPHYLPGTFKVKFTPLAFDFVSKFILHTI